MENETQPTIQQTQAIQQVSNQALSPTNRLKFLLFILILLITIVASIFIGIQIGKSQKIIQQPVTVQPMVSPKINPVDSKAVWKTYTNQVLKYTIEYPSDWSIDISEAEVPISDSTSQKLVIYKDQYKLTILWPSAYGPGICLFDDESRVGAPEMASFCEGKFVEFDGKDGKNIYRRLIKPETIGDHQEWGVYTKGETYFVTVPPIKFSAPLAYTNDQIDLMDQILASYKSTK